MGFSCPVGLENQLKCKLNHAGVPGQLVHRLIGDSKRLGGKRRRILHVADSGASRDKQMRVIPEVEEFSPEIEPRPLRYRDVLDEREVGVDVVGARDRGTRCVSQLAGRRLHESTGIKPVAAGNVNPRRRSASGICRDGTRSVRIAHKIGTVQC